MKVLLKAFGRSSSQMLSTSFLVPCVDDLPEILFQSIEKYQKRCAVGVFDCHKNCDKIYHDY